MAKAKDARAASPSDVIAGLNRETREEFERVKAALSAVGVELKEATDEESADNAAWGITCFHGQVAGALDVFVTVSNQTGVTINLEVADASLSTAVAVAELFNIPKQAR